MEIESYIQLINANRVVQIGLTSDKGSVPLTADERAAFSSFGEPVVECGGTFTANGLTFTLPSNSRRLPSEFPVKITFSSDDPDSNAKAALFRDTLIARMTSARNTQINRNKGTLGRQIISV